MSVARHYPCRYNSFSKKLAFPSMTGIGKAFRRRMVFTPEK